MEMTSLAAIAVAAFIAFFILFKVAQKLIKLLAVVALLVVGAGYLYINYPEYFKTVDEKCAVCVELRAKRTSPALP